MAYEMSQYINQDEKFDKVLIASSESKLLFF